MSIKINHFIPNLCIVSLCSVALHVNRVLPKMHGILQIAQIRSNRLVKRQIPPYLTSKVSTGLNRARLLDTKNKRLNCCTLSDWLHNWKALFREIYVTCSWKSRFRIIAWFYRMHYMIWIQWLLDIVLGTLQALIVTCSSVQWTMKSSLNWRYPSKLWYKFYKMES